MSRCKLLLTLEEIRAIVRNMKDDYQRQANQGIRKRDWEQGVGALGSMEACDSFLHSCSLLAGEFSQARAKRRHQILGAPKKRRRGAGGE
jgi:hypothetical protein